MQRNDQNQFNQGSRSWPQRDTQDQWSRDEDFRGTRGNYPDQGRAQYEANREEQNDYGRFPGYGQYAGHGQHSSGGAQGFSSHGMNRQQEFDAQGYTGGFQSHGGSQGYGAGSQSYGGYSGSSQGYSGSGYGGPQGSGQSYGGGWQTRNQGGQGGYPSGYQGGGYQSGGNQGGGGQRNYAEQNDRSYTQPYYGSQGSQRAGNTGGYPDYQREDTAGGWRSGQMNQGRRGNAPKNYKRSDDRINEEVCETFINGGLDCGCAEVSVKNGVCTLNGEVNSRSDKYRMEEMASGVSGVSDVENNLKIKSPGHESQGSTSGSSSGGTGSSASTFGQGQSQGQSGFGKDAGSGKR